MIMPVLHGMTTMGFVLAGMHFLRFWWRTKDKVFIVFAISFWLLALHQMFLGLTGGTNAKESWVFLPSLGAFSLLILVILIKNIEGATKDD